MGGSSYSGDAAARIYADRSTKSAASVFKNTTTHTFDPTLDVRKKLRRESRDSAAHPESNAIAVFFDQTGSMGGIPRKFAFEDLPKFMRLLVEKNYIPHPQVLFGNIGDGAWNETAPLQVGEFESGMEMDDCLTKMLLEGNGGGGGQESYDLAIFYAARYMDMDCFEKRGKKGYLFTIGDEQARDVDRRIVEKYLGVTIQDDIPIEVIIKEVQKKFNYFHICVPTGYPDGSHSYWKKLLGQNALLIDDPAHVCELMGATIGAIEGRDLDDIKSDLISGGSSHAAASAAVKAMIPFAAAGGAVAKAGVSGSLAKAGAPAAKSKRL
jgi:hypothetical protein